ncbi:MAG: Maf-like protein [Prevotella sp.]|nr:Maf-like protein [Prevotella sp.]
MSGVCKNYKIILASGSPRRRELLSALDIDYELRVGNDVDESYPASLPPLEIAEYISRKKSSAYVIADDELLITADTVVVLGSEVLGKPKDLDDAKRMLGLLAGKTHQVVTGCCLRTNAREKHFSVVSDVTFAPLAQGEIDYYVETYRPLDKAGAYGVQEWIGCVGVSEIRGSYFNVMGLPVQRVYEALKEFAG